MYEGILVPLDGSKGAEVVLPYVEEIAARSGAVITLVSVCEPAAGETDQLYRSYLERTAEKVERQLEDWGAQGKVKVEAEVLLGKPATEILRYADERRMSLVAVASRGRSGRGPWLLGAIAAKVLRATDRPVLLIRAPARDMALQEKRLVKRILMPLDGSRVGEAAIPCAETLARTLGAELFLFHVVEPVTVWAGFEGGAYHTAPQDEARQKASAIAYLQGIGGRLREKGLSASSAIASGSVADQIIDYATTKAIDLIAMSTHGRSGITRWVFGSVTDKVLHAGDTPVLTVRATKG